MKYILRVVDLSGRGYKSLLDYDTEAEREEKFRENLKSDGADDEEIEDAIATLEAGGTYIFEATEYEYF